jgi:hypothetical protein
MSPQLLEISNGHPPPGASGALPTGAVFGAAVGAYTSTGTFAAAGTVGAAAIGGNAGAISAAAALATNSAVNALASHFLGCP